MSESIEKKLLRARPPRVKITYDVESGGVLEKKELPFIVGILADLKGHRDPAVEYPTLKTRTLVDIDRDNFNDVMAAIAPCATLAQARQDDVALQELLTDPRDKQLIFSSMEAFAPVNVIQALPSLNTLYQTRRQMRELQAKAEASDSIDTQLGAVIDRLKTSAVDRQTALCAPLPGWSSDISDGNNATADQASALLGSFVTQLNLCFVAPPAIGDDIGVARAREQKRRQGAGKIIQAAEHGPGAVIDELVAQIDCRLSEALSSIMHCDSFQTMEATWRGLHYLVVNTETSAMLKLRVLSATKEELRKDMMNAAGFDQSHLFKLICEAEYGAVGGNPYSLLIGDYKIGNSGGDVDFISRMAGMAAAAHAPFIAQASEKLFHLSGFDALHDLRKIREGADMAGWQAFRELEDARYVSLVLPRVLLRLPYGAPDNRNTIQCDGLNFDEQAGGDGAGAIYNSSGEPVGYPDPEPDHFLWGNPAYLLGQRITNAFALYSWTAAIRGVEGGGLVDGLPCYTYSCSDGSIKLLCPTEVSISDRREQELRDLGFISLCHREGTGQAVFFGGQTNNQSKKYSSDPASAGNPAILPYMLAASRFAHYIKVIVRDKVGSFMTRGNIEDYLNSWISNYVLLDDNASQEAKAGYPLREARVAVADLPGEPGSYRATIFLKPHFQLEDLATSIRLVC